MKLLQKNKMKNNNLNTEKSSRRWASSAPSRVTITKSIAKKSTTSSLPPAVPLAITPTFSPWTHTSDDSYIYQLSLVLATATVSLFPPLCVLVCWCIDLCVHRGLALSYHQGGTNFGREGGCGGPSLCAPSISARVQNRFEFVELGRDMSSNCTRRHWDYRLVPSGTTRLYVY